MSKKIIDLFCGAGGFSYGFEKEGFESILAIDKWDQAVETYNLNHKNKTAISMDIKEYDNKKIENLLQKNEVIGIIGGPPCQGFSMAGQRNENDDRNKLIDSYVKFISLVKPKLIFFENVKGFTMEFKDNGKKGRKYSEIVIEKLQKEGYNVYGQLINFGDYGIPQKRTRFILIGIRADIENSSVEKADKSSILSLSPKRNSEIFSACWAASFPKRVWMT